MEEHLGRYLYPDETVHHKYGVRDDNRLDQLELWVKPQPCGIRAQDAVIWAKEIIERYDSMETTVREAQTVLDAIREQHGEDASITISGTTFGHVGD